MMIPLPAVEGLEKIATGALQADRSEQNPFKKSAFIAPMSAQKAGFDLQLDQPVALAAALTGLLCRSPTLMTR